MCICTMQYSHIIGYKSDVSCVIVAWMRCNAIYLILGHVHILIAGEESTLTKLYVEEHQLQIKGEILVDTGSNHCKFFTNLKWFSNFNFGSFIHHKGFFLTKCHERTYFQCKHRLYSLSLSFPFVFIIISYVYRKLTTNK